MKILKQGKWETPETWRKEVNCFRCDSKLEIDAGDITYQPPKEYGHPCQYTPESCSTVCPVCHATIKVMDVPFPITRYLARKVPQFS